LSVLVQRYLSQKGFDCNLDEVLDGEHLIVRAKIGGQELELVLIESEPFTSMPKFVLLNPYRYPNLAHVSARELDGAVIGTICVNDRDSVSVNFARPELAAEESLRRHISLLERTITDPEWNERELLREFYSNWLEVCDLKGERPLLVACAAPVLQSLAVYSPQQNAKFGLDSHYLVEPSDISLSPITGINWSATRAKRSLAGKAIVVPIDVLRPAPSDAQSVQEWYIQTIEKLPEETRENLQHKYGQWREKQYWVIFTAETVSSERTWFVVKLTSKSKKTLPVKRENFELWKIKAQAVRIFSHDNVVRRGGGKVELQGKRVALVGAGSVGCEIAHKLSSAGISKLTIFDSDVYSIDNLYRHILPEQLVGFNKSEALSFKLHSQFPWSNAKSSTQELLEIDKTKWSSFDLIIIAIGRPTHELLFKQQLLDYEIEVPVINCWLEGFGVGGHAVLDIPGSKGCLLCSYVCTESGMRGLSANLNFIEQNQNVTKNIAGCGEQYISYGAVCSAQTALMATDLAIKFLDGKVSESCKVSWKGDDDEATQEGIRLTHRYYHFDNSFKRLPLLDEDCDVCNVCKG
jgi:hypothetical protein